MKTKEIYQSETVEIERSRINFAPYNPRKDDPEVVKSIKDNLKNVGYFGGIVWNERTGNIVSGHKRIQAMDMLYKYDGTPEKDYPVKVEKVDIDLKTEMEQNIYMNNKNVQGVYDYKALSMMLPDIDIDKTGLSQLDLDKISIFSPVKIELPKVEVKPELTPEQKQEKKEAIQKLKKDIKDGYYDQADEISDTYITIAFDSEDDKVSFMERLGLNIDSKMIMAEEINAALDELETIGR